MGLDWQWLNARWDRRWWVWLAVAAVGYGRKCAEEGLKGLRWARADMHLPKVGVVGYCCHCIRRELYGREVEGVGAGEG